MSKSLNLKALVREEIAKVLENQSTTTGDKNLFDDLPAVDLHIDDNGNILYTTLINNPQTFITTVGMYNDSNELLAVAKLSKPLVKDFTKEALIRVKLDY